MRTKFILLLAAAAFGAAACTKNLDNPSEPAGAVPGVGETVTLSVSVPLGTPSKAFGAPSKAFGTPSMALGAPTKASGSATEANETALKSVQVFVFNSSNNLEAYQSATTGSVNLTCTKGAKTIAAVVNGATLSGIKTLSELSGTVSQFSENSAEGLVMYGTTAQTIETNTSVTLEVARLAAKVVIGKITNNISMTQYQGSPITINAIYLINVAGDAKFTGAYTPSLWLNQSENSASADNLYYENPSSLTIAHNASDASGHYFYCYPNPTSEDSTASEWSARHTRLVVEATVGGQTCYYPITLPVVNANTVYTVSELKITMIGTDSPDVVDAKGSASFTITVAPWNNQDVGNVTI